jgi:hypothetical protein
MTKLVIKNKEINFTRNIAEVIKTTGAISESDVQGNLEKLFKLYKIDNNYSLKFMCNVLNICYLESKLIFKYVKKCGEENFSHERFKEYLKYRETNPSDCNSEKNFKLVYGEDYLKYHKQYKEKPKKSIYDPNYIMTKLNLNYEQATDYVKNYKKNKATSKENFIRKYGIENGAKKFEQFQQTSKHTKEKYIKEYGNVEGIKKWEEYVHLKKITSNRSIEYWLSKYPDTEEAEYYRQEFHRNNCNTSSVDFWVSKGMSLDDAVKKVKNIMLKKQVSFCSASKESLKYFKPLHDYLVKLNKKIMLGVEGNEEMLIYDQEHKKIRFYDFAILPEKLIIEFHGFKFHPNPEKLSKEEWRNWKCGQLNRDYQVTKYLTADEAYSKDLAKKQLAISKGFKYLVIWSNDCKQDNVNKIVNFLQENKIEISLQDLKDI